MTCIVGLISKGKVYIGGDSAAVGGLSISSRKDTKVFKNGEFMFGFTSSFRMGQLLRFSFTAPDHPARMGDEEFMMTRFVNAVRECLKAGGYARAVNGEEEGGTFIVGYRGKMYLIYSDYQVGIPSEEYAAVGCGQDLALGALFASSVSNLEPEARINLALGAAEAFSAGVRPPFNIISSEEPQV